MLTTGGVALAFAVTAILLQADSLIGDIQKLGECFVLCDDFAQSGGRQETTYVVALDRTSGELTLTYEMFRIPDQLELIYEGNVIFSTGGLVSGRRTITRTIDGDSDTLAVKITAPRSGTGWNFQLTCPAPVIEF